MTVSDTFSGSKSLTLTAQTCPPPPHPGPSCRASCPQKQVPACKPSRNTRSPPYLGPSSPLAPRDYQARAPSPHSPVPSSVGSQRVCGFTQAFESLSKLSWGMRPMVSWGKGQDGRSG